VLSRLVGEINRSFSYFRSQPGGGPVVRVIITGGGACLRNVIPYLQRSLGVEVRIAQPLAGLAIAPGANDASEHPEQACVALGLALRCCERVTVEINLIPPIILEVAKRKEQAFYWLLSLTTLYLILASIIPITVKRTELEREEIKSLQNILAAYDAQLIGDPTRPSAYVAELNTAKSDVEKFIREVESLDNLRNNRQFFLDPLMAVWEARQRSLSKGNIAFSSIQTVVLGGPENTGAAARNLKPGQQQNAAQPTQTNAQPPSGGARFNLQVSAPGGAAGEYNISGFPGLNAPLELRGAESPQRPASRRGPTVQANRSPNNLVRVTEPNGFAIFGYAEELDGIRELVTQLENSGAFIGVYWHEAFTDQKDFGVLGSATRGEVTGGGGSRLGRQAPDDEPAMTFGSPTSTPTSAPVNVSGPQVWEFRIDVQWLGRPVTHPDKTASNRR
jgi:hypothetical protein